VFCKILQDDKLNQIIMRGRYVTAIKKLYKPKNVDFLIIPNRHIVNLKEPIDMEYRDLVLSEIVDLANLLSGGKDWSMHINNGANSNQTVFHLHAHITSNVLMSSWFEEYFREDGKLDRQSWSYCSNGCYSYVHNDLISTYLRARRDKR